MMVSGECQQLSVSSSLGSVEFWLRLWSEGNARLWEGNSGVSILCEWNTAGRTWQSAHRGRLTSQRGGERSLSRMEIWKVSFIRIQTTTPILIPGSSSFSISVLNFIFKNWVGCNVSLSYNTTNYRIKPCQEEAVVTGVDLH